MDRAILVDQPMRENWLLQKRASLPRDEGDLQRLVGDLAFLSFSPQVVLWAVTGRLVGKFRRESHWKRMAGEFGGFAYQSNFARASATLGDDA